MAISGSLQLFGTCSNHRRDKRFGSSRTRGKLRLLGANLSSFSLRQCSWSIAISKSIHRHVRPISSRNHQFKCHCVINTGPPLDITSIKNAILTLTGSINRMQGSPLVIKLASAIGIVIFAIWGLGPLVRQSRNIFPSESDDSWKKSSIHHVTTSYVQPLLLWAGAIYICRVLDPVILPSQAGQIVKQRVLNFVRSLSTVLACAHCLSSVIHQSQKFFMDTNDSVDTRNMGFQFMGRAIYTAVWVAAVSLFMELLGFSTQKWITAGGFGTVLLTLAGREIFTNFLSSVMIHATRPFVLNEWIQTKIDGYEVSGTVEHVGWWSPTIIRGDDREAVHIPNHKFTVNIVRNLSQKTHWRIKTHLAISHLDVGKINNIVADMRKVLAKNPQVEQQKLHRRVFLDYINHENQALSIMVSCFVKTSRFEEYMCVKEAVLLDLLRVITHHRARLATPIRTVQKVYTDADLDSVPFSDTAFTPGATSNRSLLLIEPSYKINGEEKTKTQNQARTARINGNEDSKATPRSTFDSKMDVKNEATLISEEHFGETELDYNNTKEVITSDDKAGEVGKKAKVDKTTMKSSDSSATQQKQDVRSHAPTNNKPSLEENIVLGVALEGSKRTLPIEEDKDMGPTSTSKDAKEFATVAEKGKGDTKRTNPSGSPSSDQSDQQQD